MAMVLPDLAQGKVTTITADVESNLIDLDRILPPPDTTNAKSAKPLAIPEIPDVSLSATVNVKSVKAFGMQLSALRSVTTLNSGVVAMKNSAGVYGGTFAQSLDANLSNPKSISFKTLININGVEAAELLPAIKARIPQASVRSLTKGVSGKGNISVTASGSGDPATISKQLTADIVANFSNGKLALPLFGKMTTSLHKIYAAIPDLKEINFNTFRVVGQVRDGILELQDMSLDGNEVGSVLAKGKVGLDQAIAMTADIHLPKIASGPIMAGGAAASGYLKGLGLDATIAPPADAENRVIVSYLIGGTLADPTYKADTPRLGSLAKGMAASLVSQKKKEAEALVARQRAELEARAASEKQKLQDAARAKANEATKTATDKAKNEIGKRLKGFGL
jgi:AsmA protein